jgi:hypothetical protein
LAQKNDRSPKASRRRIAESTPMPTMLERNTAETRPCFCSGVKTAMSAASENRKAATEATTRAAGATHDESAPPLRMAPAPQPRPSRRWTRSRMTRARPTIRTPLEGGEAGGDGMRQGPPGRQVVPTSPIIQLAAGMEAAKTARKRKPFRRRRWAVCMMLTFLQTGGTYLRGAWPMPASGGR